MKIFVLLLLGVMTAGPCFAQSANPSLSPGESSSTSVSPAVDQQDSQSSSDSSVGYDSGNHGNVN